MQKQPTKFAQAMDENGVKPDALAHESGLSIGYIYKLRRGDQRPSYDVAVLLSKLVGSPLDVFSDGDCPIGPAPRNNRTAEMSAPQR